MCYAICAIFSNSCQPRSLYSSLIPHACAGIWHYRSTNQYRPSQTVIKSTCRSRLMASYTVRTHALISQDMIFSFKEDNTFPRRLFLFVQLFPASLQLHQKFQHCYSVRVSACYSVLAHPQIVSASVSFRLVPYLRYLARAPSACFQHCHPLGTTSQSTAEASTTVRARSTLS